MKKSFISKFLLGTLFIPAALVGSCKAAPVKLETPYLMNVLKYLSNIEDKHKFIKVSRTARDAFYRNYLLDLTSFGTNYDRDDNEKRLLIRSLIKDYSNKHEDSKNNCTDKIKGTIAIPYGDCRDRRTVSIIIEELLNEEVVKELKDKIGVILIDKSYPNLEELKILLEKYPNAKLFMHKVKYFEVLNELDKDNWYGWGFNVLEVNADTDLQSLNQFLSRFNNQKTILKISNRIGDVKGLGALLRNHQGKINVVIFSDERTNPECLKNISETYFLPERQTYSQNLNYVQRLNLGQTNICLSPMVLDSWDDFNNKDYTKSTNVFELKYEIFCFPSNESRVINKEYYKLIELVSNTAVTNEIINKYFDNRKRNIEKIFELEKYLFLFDTFISFISEEGEDNEVQKAKLINEKLIQELEFISDKLKAKKGGEVKLKVDMNALLTEDFYNRLIKKENVSIYYGKSIRSETFDEIKAEKEKLEQAKKAERIKE